MILHLPGMLSPGVLTRCCSGVFTWLRTPGERVYANR